MTFLFSNLKKLIMYIRQGRNEPFLKKSLAEVIGLTKLIKKGSRI